MSHYQQHIGRIVSDCDPRHVEAYMRGDFGTLDHLSEGRFMCEAQVAAELVRMDTSLAEDVALSYGL